MTETLTACPICGERDALRVTERDRYGEPYQLWLCAGCTVLYANPRRTEEEAREFYASGAYRRQYGTEEEAQPLRSVLASSISGFLRGFGIRPRTVVEVGCGRGDWLVELREAFECEVYGWDDDPAMYEIARGRGVAGEIRRGRPDLVVFNHVLEHLRDPAEEIDAIVRYDLAPRGHIFIAVPGLHTWDTARLWQSAHTFQFTQASLTNLMRRVGMVPVYADEMVTSLWRREEDAVRATSTELGRILLRVGKVAPPEVGQV